jgi:hypothetical protein
MKRFVMAAVTAGVLATGFAQAQVQAGVTSPLGRTVSEPAYTVTQKVADGYRGRGAPAAGVVEQLYARGLAPTPANIALVRGWLAGAGGPDYKVAVIRLLGSLYRSDAPAATRLGMARDIRAQVQSGDRRVALAAVQTFARLGFQNDLPDVLDDARVRGIIDDDDYAQEVALALPLAPPGRQPALAAKLAEKNNAFGAQVLASTLTTPAEVARIAPAAAATLRDYMAGREPVLSVALGNFGLGDGGRYAEWLHTVAMLEEASGKRSYAQAVWARLNDENTDPRKILGFMTAPEGQAFIRTQGGGAAFARPAERARAYAAQFPDHPVMAPLTQSMEHALAPAAR